MKKYKVVFNGYYVFVEELTIKHHSEELVRELLNKLFPGVTDQDYYLYLLSPL